MNKKFLLVSDRSKFSTKDVYTGYCEAFRQANINYEFYPLHDFLTLYSADTCFCQIIAKALIPQNNITHVLFISGLEIPVYVYDALHAHDIKVGIIATDDPHSSMPIFSERKNYIDYWFTNEKAVAYDNNEKAHYLPVAANNTIPFYEDREKIPEEYRSDVLFIGSAYPNRIPYLEAAAKWCKSAGKRFVFAGHSSYVMPHSILNEYKIQGTIDNQETLKYLQGAQCTINISRDIKWHPYLPYNSRLWHCDPISSNPRMYEAAICKCLQITLDDRKEYREWIGESGFYFLEKSELPAILEFVCNALTPETRQSMVDPLFEKVLAQGCYQHRVIKMLSIIHNVDEARLREKMNKDFEEGSCD